MARAKEKTEDIIKLTITLRSGAEFELASSRDDAINFHKRYKKWVDQQIHKTDNHRLLSFGGAYFHSETIAAYSGVDFEGKAVDLGPLN